MSQIDANRLKELAENPTLTAREIRLELGYKNDAAFYYQLNKDPELHKIFYEGREFAKATGVSQAGHSPTKSSARKTTKKKAKKTQPPPRKNGANGANKELFKRLQHEFEHIEIYNEVSEHFDDLRDAVAALI